jgi:glutathione S-transferase
MQLWYATTSPFARKARIAAHELGMADRLTVIEVNPWLDPRLRALNPLAKVPTLVRNDGEVVWESGLIAERLEAMTGGRVLFPPEGPPRWRALSLQALADGASTAAGRLFADEQREPAERSGAMLLRFQTSIDAVLDHLESLTLQPEPTIGEISVGVLLGYLDFRWPDRDWREPRPKLTEWFEAIAARPSFVATAH